MSAVNYKARLQAISVKMNTAISTGKIRELRKVGEECHSEAFQIMQEVNAIPDSSKALKKAALDLFIAVRMGSTIDVDLNDIE